MNGEHHEPDQPEQEGHEHDDEELRARLQEELSKVTVRDVLVQTVVALIILGGQRLGLSESTKEASDPDQTRVAIEAIRSLLPLLESDPGSAEQMKPVRDGLAQLQMAYAQLAGTPPSAPAEAESDDAGAKDRPPSSSRQSGSPSTEKPSGRLWVPPGTTT